MMEEIVKPIEIKINKLDSTVITPFKAYETDACYDIVATGINFHNNYIEYNTNLYIVLPSDTECIIRSRSSISNTDLILANGIGTVDPGYRGELKLRFKIALSPELLMSILKGDLKVDNFYDHLKLYNIGDKIGQISFHKVLKTEFKVLETNTDKIEDTDRGEKGFGSSN